MWPNTPDIDGRKLCEWDHFAFLCSHANAAFSLSAEAGQPCAAARLRSGAVPRARRTLQPLSEGPAPRNPPPRSQRDPLAARTPTGARGSGLDFRPPFGSLRKSHLCTPALSHCIHFGQGGTAPTFRGAADHVLVTVTIHQTDTLSSAASLVTFFNPWITLPSNSFIVCSLNYVHSTEVNPVPSVPTVIINSSWSERVKFKGKKTVV